MKCRVYTSAQVAQHTQLILDLQQSNARASHLMLRLGRMPLQHHRFKALCEDLTSLERSMTLQIFLCEQIVDSGLHKHYDVINVVFHATCDYCLESGKPRKLQDNNPHLEVLISSPAWAIQVERLYGLMISVAHNVSQTSCPPRRVEQALRSLSGLSKVLSRQRRHLQQISVRLPTKIKVIHDRSTVCPDCGHPYGAPARDAADQCIL